MPPTPAGRRRRRSRAMSSPYRPNDSRTSSTLPRGPHLREDSVIALACKRSEPATSTPERCGHRRAAGQRQRHQRRRRHVDAPRCGGGARRDPGDDRRQPGRRDGQQHRVGVPRAALVVDQPPAARPCVPTARWPPGPSARRHTGSARRATPCNRRRARRTPSRSGAAAAPRGPRRSGSARRGPAPRPAPGRPTAVRWWQPTRHTRLPAGGRRSGSPLARRTGRRRGRRPRDPPPAARSAAAWVRRASAAWWRRPPVRSSMTGRQECR